MTDQREQILARIVELRGLTPPMSFLNPWSRYSSRIPFTIPIIAWAVVENFRVTKACFNAPSLCINKPAPCGAS